MAKPKATGCHIAGRRWTDKRAGSTYHSVRIFLKGECIAECPPQYGYENMYIKTACEKLAELGLIPQGKSGTIYLREILKASWDCADVARERDL